MADLPDALRPLESFLGTWRGEGAGAVPGGLAPDFPYVEELTLAWEGGGPWITYNSRTSDPDTGKKMHAESGWWRPKPVDDDGKTVVEIVLVHATGVVEVLLGELVDGPAGVHVEVASDVVARTPSAPAVAADRRMYAVRGGKLMYAIDLATGEAGLVPHLAAALDPVTT
ncbi:MAG TPA: FABP family protein [Mycobacteriales bacterium]|jgi:hypothetical protein|nr:FABP family protein [Mycobacteriales bacterium]